MFTGIAIFASVFLWLMVKEKGFRRVVFIGTGVPAVLAVVIGAGVAIWYYGIHAPAEARKAKQEESARKQIKILTPEEAAQRYGTLLSPVETARRLGGSVPNTI